MVQLETMQYFEIKKIHKILQMQGFPGGSVIKKKNLPANAGDMGSIPYPGRSYMPQNN